MIHLDTPGPIGGITLALISLVAAAEKTFSVEIGPTFALVLTGMIASVGSWITAWLAYRVATASKVKAEENDVKLTQKVAETDIKLTQVHDAVNSTAKDLAAKLTATEKALLDVTRLLAESESEKVQLVTQQTSAPVGKTAEKSLVQIDENTAATAKNTAKTDATVQELKDQK